MVIQVYKEIRLVQRRKTSIQERGNHMHKRQRCGRDGCEYRSPCREQHTDLTADRRNLKTKISKMVATSLSLFTFMHWRRKWQPTPVFLPGESQGRGSLVGCRLWGRTESDTTEVS